MTREDVIKALIKERKTALHENKQAFDMAIKALEQQPSEDCVSRQAVLEIVNDWWGITSTSGEPTLCDCIRDLPPVTPTQRWIPVSERLPQMKEQVLCCEKDKVFVGCMVFECDGIPVFSKSDYKHFYVTAWMPLPEPYKAEMESEE